jgi:hypothetical protein
LLREDRGGAAIVEFVVVVVPLTLAFFSLAQISMLYAAKLVMRHAAICAVRAYTVIAPPNPGINGDATTDPVLAGTIAMGPWYNPGGNGITAASFQFASTADETPPDGYYGLDTATVTGLYQCSVPLGRWVACVGSFQPLGPYTASLPHQGARYCTGSAGSGCP